MSECKLPVSQYWHWLKRHVFACWAKPSKPKTNISAYKTPKPISSECLHRYHASIFPKIRKIYSFPGPVFGRNKSYRSLSKLNAAASLACGKCCDVPAVRTSKLRKQSDVGKQYWPCLHGTWQRSDDDDDADDDVTARRWRHRSLVQTRAYMSHHIKRPIIRTSCRSVIFMGVNATGTLGSRRSSAEDARIEAPL